MNLFLLLLAFVIVCYVGIVLGYWTAQRVTRERCQQLLDAWAADNGHARILIHWDGDDLDPGQ